MGLEDEACSICVGDTGEMGVEVVVNVGKLRLGPSGLLASKNTNNAMHIPPTAISRIIPKMTFCERIFHDTH